MGNTVTHPRRAKVMTIDGKTFELKTPIRASDVTDDYPGHVLIESEAVKNYGIRAEPLEPQQELKSQRLYFLVEIPKNPMQEKYNFQRKIQAGVNMSAKERMESLILSQRASSDLTFEKPKNLVDDSGMVRLKLKLPKSEVTKLMEDSYDASEAAEKLMDLCITKTGLAPEHYEDYRYTRSGPLIGYQSNGGYADHESSYSKSGPLLPTSHWRPGLEDIKEGSNKPRPREKKKVSFLPVKDDLINLD
ncbi:hypothetical protein NE237_007634 [Protea cynaroides]|uniref:Uncharacterized protein n=1 Tax=Protea cynaroides TaxID=273540 RepID=A0A9Q0QWM6_9MAGN|nr:hypothetical protein NE237_007634 [Protea cynaroides]